jgi:eukaryotic-like serine/threonine-protein kinase
MRRRSTTMSGRLDFEGTDRFEIVGCLGSGGMGIVYEAHDRDRDCRVALKTLHDVKGEELLRLKNEFRALQSVAHDNLVHLIEFIEDRGRWFFTMELVDGDNFVDYVRPKATRTASATTMIGLGFDETKLRASLLQLANGLATLHEAGMVHRDVKPGNIMVTPHGRVVLLDLGLVTSMRFDSASISNQTVGTAAYMAPEQAAGHRVDAAADWYAVGVLLYEALTGTLPFEGHPLQMMLEKQTEAPPPPRSKLPQIPADLDALCMALLRTDPATRPSGAAVRLRLGAVDLIATPTSSGHAPPFVGRLDERAQLRAAYAAVAAGRAVSVLVQGESGVGKSALVRRCIDEFEAQGALVLVGRCYEREAVPYKTIDRVIDALSRFMAQLPVEEAAALLPRGAALLADTFPVLRRVKAIATAPRMSTEGRLDPQEQRSRMFAALRELLGRVADRRALVVVIDDLHWADDDGLAMLAEILRPPDEPALLVIGVVRSGAGDGVVATADLVRALGNAQLLPIAGLPASEASELARQLLKRAGVNDDRAAQSIAAEAAGHPLFIDELARHMSSHGGERVAPLLLDEALVERAAAMPEHPRRVLDVVAIAGRPTRQDVIAVAVGLDRDPTEFNRALSQLRTSNLVQTGGSRGRDTVMCFHDRVRESVATALTADARRGLHRDLAWALDASGTADPETLAFHWAASGETARAAVLAERGGDLATRACAFQHAARMYTEALEWSTATPAEQRGLRIKLASALANAGRGREAAETYLLSSTTAPPGEQEGLLSRAAEQYMRGGYFDKALAATVRVLGAIGQRLPSTHFRAMSAVLFRRALIRLRGLRFRLRTAHEVAPERLSRIDICHQVATFLGHIDTVRGADFHGRVLLWSLRTGEPKRIARALALEGLFLSFPGRSRRARVDKLFRTADELSAVHGDRVTEAWITGARGYAAYYEGRFRDARDSLVKAETALAESVGTQWELTAARYIRQFAEWRLGDIAAIHREVPRLLAEARDRGDLFQATYVRLGFLNCAWLVDDNPDGADEARREAIAAWPTNRFMTVHWEELTADMHLRLYREDAEPALAHLERQLPRVKSAFLLGIHPVRVESWWMRARCLLTMANTATGRRRGQLVKAIGRDVARIRAENVPWTSGVADLIAAGAAAADRNLDGAATLLTRAVAGLAGADMQLLATIARWRLGRLRAGTDGAIMRDDAETWLRGQGIVAPTRWAAMLAPGFA